MQGTGTNRRKWLTITVIIASIIALIAIDQILKQVFLNLENQGKLPIKVIKNFFEFTFVYNTGSAYGFLSDAKWAQVFFKILTPIALCFFVFLLILGIRKKQRLLVISMGFVIAGTLGNYIDRLLISKVIDFLSIIIGGDRIFGIFNVADMYLSVGIILVLVHFMFLDENAIFSKKKDGKNDNSESGN